MAVFLVFAGFLHLIVVCCVAGRFFPNREGEEVYNYFRTPQYEILDDSLIVYLINDKYYSVFGNCITIAWTLCLITFIYEVSYTVCIFTIDERFTRPTRRSAASRGSVDYRV